VDSILKRVAGFLRWLSASEQLPDTAPPRAPERSVTAWLLASDAIDAAPTDGPHRRRPPGFLSALLAPETLPQRDTPARDDAARTGFLKELLSPQELPRVQPLPRPQGRGFIRWLLSRDEL